MLWKRLGDPAPSAGKNPFARAENSEQPVTGQPMAGTSPEPLDPALPAARLPLTNSGERRLEIFIEPYCWSEWLEQGASVTVVTVGRADKDRPWSGTTVPNEPFQLDCLPDMLVIWRERRRDAVRRCCREGDQPDSLTVRHHPAAAAAAVRGSSTAPGGG